MLTDRFITTRKSYEAYMAKHRETRYVTNKLQEKLFNTIEIP